jgi:ubiquinone/menaquinone biosynthesis C-methylase UbiE
MNETVTYINEKKAAKAFSEQSKIFDELYSENKIVQYKRERVRSHVKKYLKSGSFILELNSGTGEDAVWFAKEGYNVHATDISTGMMEKLKEKINTYHLQSQVSHEVISFTELNLLFNKGPYDLIFSNFAGLNCTNELNKVLRSFSSLLKPNGVVTLVILPKFCLWESLLLFKGKFNTAFRRFFSRNGRNAHIEGHFFKCWYYNPSYITDHLKNDFELLSIEGLCTLVPPSYIENFAEKRPGLYSNLKKKEEKWKNKWPWKYIGDYYIISLQKRS